MLSLSFRLLASACFTQVNFQLKSNTQSNSGRKVGARLRLDALTSVFGSSNLGRCEPPLWLTDREETSTVKNEQCVGDKSIGKNAEKGRGEEAA